MADASKQDVTRVRLNFSGRINGGNLVAAGESRGVLGSGHITAHVTATEMPTRFALGVLGYVALTGQPSMSRTIGDAENPFLDAGGQYEANRSLDLGPKGRLDTEYRVSRNSDGLVADFSLAGEVDLPRLVRIYPTIETWNPMGPGRVAGQFTMVWQSEDGSDILGKTDTLYHLDERYSLTGTHFREIRIDLSVDDHELQQSEHIAV